MAPYRTRSWILKRILWSIGLVGLIIFGTYHGLQAYEVHRGLEELKRFERLMDAEVIAGRNSTGHDPQSPISVLLIQYIHRRGPLEVVSQRSHAAYARSWGYRYKQGSRHYDQVGQHVMYNKIYYIQEVMEAELASADPAEWIL